MYRYREVPSTELEDRKPNTIIPKLQIKFKDILWWSNFWDGPLEGMLEYQGEKCYYKFAAETIIHRRFLVLRLTKEQLESEERQHAMFVDIVTNGPVSGHHRWYDYKKTIGEINLEDNLVLGWFQI
jgi:hypothetical protein